MVGFRIRQENRRQADYPEEGEEVSACTGAEGISALYPDRRDAAQKVNWLERVALKVALRKFLEGKQMEKILEWFSGKKTYLAGVGSILLSLLSLVGVAIPGVPILTHDTAIQTIITALMGIFIRQGVSKVPQA